MAIATAIPKTMDRNFWRLKLCPSELSKSMVVEIWKRIPTINGSIWLIISGESISPPKKLPMGLIKAKRNNTMALVTDLTFVWCSSIPTTKPMGILWILTASSKVGWVLRGKPSKNAWMHKLMINTQGSCLFAAWWACPCSAPLEKNSRRFWKRIPIKIQRPAV